MKFLHPEERAEVEQARTEIAPDGVHDRVAWQLLRATAEVMAARTVAIDEAVYGGLAGQLVLLGAGLDARAWRLRKLKQVDVFEVDRREAQQDKIGRVGEVKAYAKSLHYVPVDIGHDDLGRALKSAGHDPRLPTTWVWEGVVPYLTPEEVASTVASVRSMSAMGSRLVVNYQQPARRARLGRLLVALVVKLVRGENPLAGEPHRSSWTPASMSALLGEQGFTVVRDDNLLGVATTLGLEIAQRGSLENGRIAVADLA